MQMPTLGTKLALPSNIQRPKKLRIYLNQAAANSTIGGTFVHAVYLKVSNGWTRSNG